MKHQSSKNCQSLMIAALFAILTISISQSVSAQEGPKPDFSAMEKYYQVIRYEYDFTANIPQFHLVAKRKAEKVPKWWIVKWFDADGVVISTGSLLFDPGFNATIDDPIRSSTYAPWKREMPKVKRVVVYENMEK